MRLIPIQSANCGMKYLVSNVFSSQNILCQVFSLQPIDTFGRKISVGNQEVKGTVRATLSMVNFLGETKRVAFNKSMEKYPPFR